jgi:hypothetical protein
VSSWAWPTELLHPLPSTITTTEGSVLEPLGVALHALDLSGLPYRSDGCGHRLRSYWAAAVAVGVGGGSSERGGRRPA